VHDAQTYWGFDDYALLRQTTTIPTTGNLWIALSYSLFRTVNTYHFAANDSTIYFSTRYKSTNRSCTKPITTSKTNTNGREERQTQYPSGWSPCFESFSICSNNHFIAGFFDMRNRCQLPCTISNLFYQIKMLNWWIDELMNRCSDWPLITAPHPLPTLAATMDWMNLSASRRLKSSLEIQTEWMRAPSSYRTSRLIVEGSTTTREALVRDDGSQQYRQPTTTTSGRPQDWHVWFCGGGVVLFEQPQGNTILHILEFDSANNQNHSRHPLHLPLSTAQPKSSSLPIVVFVETWIVLAIPIKYIVVQDLRRRFHLPGTVDSVVQSKNRKFKGGRQWSRSMDKPNTDTANDFDENGWRHLSWYGREVTSVCRACQSNCCSNAVTNNSINWSTGTKQVLELSECSKQSTAHESRVNYPTAILYWSSALH
jgi:hypothetical protein